jgi:hypothetical protein
MSTTLNKVNKPVKAKPQFYACNLEPMQIIAQSHGYNLMVHGSMNRDLDFVAVPWIDNPSTHIELIHSLCDYLGVPKINPPDDGCTYMFSALPGGRFSYVINLNRGEKHIPIDPEWYIDISFTPLIKLKSI